MVEKLILSHAVECVLTPSVPFHFDGTVFKPSYFPGPGLVYETGHIWHALRLDRKLYGIRMDNLGSTDHPSIRLVIFSEQPPGDETVRQATAEMAVRYDLHTDLREFYDGFNDDELLEPALRRWRGVRSSTYSSLYEYLVIATLLQNATVRRTVQMQQNLFNRYGTWLEYDGRLLAGYWEPETIQKAAEEDLRAEKVGYRAKSLKRQAEAFRSGGVVEEDLRKLPSDQLKKALLNIYGIGPASVWYLMFGQFKRYDAFETVSPWEQKILSRLLFKRDLVPAHTILEEASRRWGQWKMLAVHILFEDLFWQRRSGVSVAWLDELIHL